MFKVASSSTLYLMVILVDVEWQNETKKVEGFVVKIGW
jgi:hypothetical protein